MLTFNKVISAADLNMLTYVHFTESQSITILCLWDLQFFDILKKKS